MNFQDFFKRWGLEKVSLSTPFCTVEVTYDEHDKIAAWNMYIEMITRITTQNFR